MSRINIIPTQRNATQQNKQCTKAVHTQDLALPIQHLEDTDDVDFTCATTHTGPGLEDIEFLLEEMLLLFHFELVDAGLAAHGEELADGGARGAVAVGRRVARQW
jgi:hypothetical protein